MYLMKKKCSLLARLFDSGENKMKHKIYYSPILTYNLKNKYSAVVNYFTPIPNQASKA